ncbi:MAG: hypothetical protein MSP55_04580, partial [Fusobacterium necrophorum]|nr:hypothetical protein [Fusobacterium necrophorum]
MKHSLEKVVKGCFKRKISMSLAILTIFAITGSMGYAQEENSIEELDKFLSTTMSDVSKLRRQFDSEVKERKEVDKELDKFLSTTMSDVNKLQRQFDSEVKERKEFDEKL